MTHPDDNARAATLSVIKTAHRIPKSGLIAFSVRILSRLEL
jgi:hypothetical protein